VSYVSYDSHTMSKSKNDASERRGITTETTEYARGYDAGFSCGYSIGVQDGWGLGWDAATKEVLS
jgi:hypothetical protein